ncbi:uncharacterized protein LOC124135136 isoform X2 [Haliotis rufescens]|uniref:uncharacterized protein LOC124135136 isoform X2 n=1 Tax=Haliotis rufescens TaxID=6454 RepID=UPI00201EA2C4|nr:uncharacterized protein LOC124135136 isoform X2 [Haliotis rufescens]
MKCILMYLATWLLLMVSFLVAEQAVVNKNSCTAVTDEGVIDLRPLANNDSSPRFVDVTKDKESTLRFSWNPCFNFDEQGCHQAELCALTPHFDLSYNLGNSSQARFIHDPSFGLILAYNASDIYDRSISIIQLICDLTEEGIFQVVDDSPAQPYHFILRSQHCCPKMQSTVIQRCNPNGVPEKDLANKLQS